VYRATVEIQGLAPLSQSRQHWTPKLDGESNDEYDKRTWREKANYDSLTGEIYVPAMALKQAMDTAATRLSIPDPDNRKAKMTKYFVSEVICESHLPIGAMKDEIPSVTISAHVTGQRGSGARVPRTFPQIQEWSGVTTFLIMNEKIKPDMFEQVLATAGRAIGVGQFRAENGGLNGRFEVVKVKYEKI